MRRYRHRAPYEVVIPAAAVLVAAALAVAVSGLSLPAWSWPADLAAARAYLNSPNFRRHLNSP